MTTENQAQDTTLGQVADQAQPEVVEYVAPNVEETDSQSEQPEVADVEEIDYEGEKFTVPKKLKDAFLRQQDYTRKTQEAAALRREAEAARETYTRLAEMRKEAIEAHGYMVALDGQISELAKVDLQQLTKQDPTQAQQLWMHLQQLKEARGNVAQSIGQYEQAAQQQKQREQAEKMQKGMEKLKREIKDLTPEYASKLRDFAVNSLGFDADAVDAINDPAVIIAINKAYMGEKVVKSAMAPTQEPVQAATPGRRLSGNAPSKVDPNKMSADEWRNWRNKQLKTPKPFTTQLKR